MVPDTLRGAIILFSIATARKALHEAPAGFFARLLEHPLVLAGPAFYFLVLLPLLFWGIWALNRRAVCKNIEPRLAELEKLRQDLLAAQ